MDDQEKPLADLLPEAIRGGDTSELVPAQPPLIRPLAGGASGFVSTFNEPLAIRTPRRPYWAV
jgi:hypothetical protein